VAYQAVKIEEPTKIHDALNGDHSYEWKAAIDLESVLESVQLID